jgi:hypothetical protein
MLDDKHFFFQKTFNGFICFQQLGKEIVTINAKDFEERESLCTINLPKV